MNRTPQLPAAVEAYLADLERSLAGTEPRERAETLAAVRDHAAEALALRGDGDAAVADVLDELGPVEAIAAEATPTPLVPTTAVDAHGRERRADGWLLALSIVSLAFFMLPPLSVAAILWTSARMRTRRGDRSRQKTALWISSAALALFVALMVAHITA